MPVTVLAVFTAAETLAVEVPGDTPPVLIELPPACAPLAAVVHTAVCHIKS